MIRYEGEIYEFDVKVSTWRQDSTTLGSQGYMDGQSTCHPCDR